MLGFLVQCHGTTVPIRGPRVRSVDESMTAFGPGEASAESLAGGLISTATRWTWPGGSSVVVKECTDAPPGLFEAEARGLTTLGASGSVLVPRVLGVGPDRLVLEDLGSTVPDEASWEHLAHDLARLHLVTSDRFGFESPNYLGRLVQRNTWTDDGHAFFAEQRVLRYLDEPRSTEALTATDRSRVEHLAARFPALVPDQPASLLHGDLWWANVIGPAEPGGRARLIDPACSYGWAEGELSMLWCAGRVPDGFWSAYQEVRPLADGWRERMPLLNIRELLSMIAHFGDDHGSVGKLRDLLDRWR